MNETFFFIGVFFILFIFEGLVFLHPTLDKYISRRWYFVLMGLSGIIGLVFIFLSVDWVM
jgi:hypothetical protein